MKKLGFMAAMIAMVFLTSVAGRAQSTTSSLTGTVTDTSGAVVVGAEVTIANTATGVNYKAKTDDRGVYRAAQLPPGSYTMQVASSGFETQSVQTFTLLVD
jgi:hypothetical protein